jgi:uncharacterized protein (TIGR00251 family)
MIIQVKAFPSARENKIIKIDENNFEVRVKEKAEDNKANFAILELVADYFKVSLSQVKFIKGIKSRNKVLKINSPR